MAGILWRAILGHEAELDFASIVLWTADTFGPRQAAAYRDVILQAIAALGDGPLVAGSRARDDLWLGARTLHVARGGRRGRHFLVYRVSGRDTIEVARILHDSMDFARHLPPSET